MKITIPGKPIAKARPRFCRAGKFVKTYDAQVSESGKWILSARDQITNPIMDGAINLSCAFHMARPKSHYGTGRNAKKLKSSAPINHTYTPDLDNLVKFVKDCLNGLAWRDDSQVVFLTAYKIYDAEPKTVVIIQNYQ